MPYALQATQITEFVDVLDKFPTDYVECISFTREDIVRGGLAGHLVSAFEDMGSW